MLLGGLGFLQSFSGYFVLAIICCYLVYNGCFYKGPVIFCWLPTGVEDLRLSPISNAGLQGISLGAAGIHLLYANRSGARLTLGDVEGAKEDADRAANSGPPSFTTAYIRQVQ